MIHKGARVPRLPRDVVVPPLADKRVAVMLKRLDRRASEQ